MYENIAREVNAILHLLCMTVFYWGEIKIAYLLKKDNLYNDVSKYIWLINWLINYSAFSAARAM